MYLENLVRSFYIDQTEGWAEIQAQQIGRYGQLEIKEIAVEYLLGATDAISARVAQRQSTQRQGALREVARNIAARVASLLERRDWQMDWPSGGSVDEILRRWTRQNLRQTLKNEANVDLLGTISGLSQRAEQLCKSLATEGIDRHNALAPVEAS